MLRKTLSLVFLLSTIYSAFSQSNNKAVKFGSNGQLTVNTRTGTYSIKYGNKFLIADIAVAYASTNYRYGTDDYTKRAITVEELSDNLGKGKLVTLLSTRSGIPTMVQRFYCYTNKGFIITELEIKGDNLQSNYMAPLVSKQATLAGNNPLQTLFVPFDNDTFIRYKSRELSEQPNTSSEIGVVYDPALRNGLVVGSLTHDSWKTGVRSAGANGQIKDLEIWGGLNDVNITRDSMAHGSLRGDKIKSPKIFIGCFNDWRTGLETFAKISAAIEGRYVKPWSRATPVGWNSWGVIGANLTYDKAVGVVDFFDKQIPAFRNADGTAYIDLDSYWDNMVKGGFRGDFSKLKEFVSYCKERNLQPGVYWAPFTDWGFKSANKDRKAEGSDYKFADMWTKTAKGYHDLDGGRALDPTHPGTRARIAFVLGKLKDCGFKMIKIDFLGHGAAESSKFYDPAIHSGMQAYAVGMRTVVDALGNSMLIYAAISPSLATAPYVHMRRIACDAFKSINDTEYTVNSLTYGWWQTYLYDYIDADHLVFEKESSGANRARLISGLISGPVILGDDYNKGAEWQDQIKNWLQLDEVKKLLISGKSFMPVVAAPAVNASPVFVRKDAQETYVAIFNYKKQPANVRIKASDLGLSKEKKYQFAELLGGKSFETENIIDVSFSSEGAFIYKVKVK